MELAISYLIFLVIGLLAAVTGSIVGLGGGIIIVPSLALLSHYFLDESISTTVAVGTSLVVLIFSAFTSSLTYMKQKRIDFLSGGLFFVTSGPAAVLGASVTANIEGSIFYVTFGIFVLLMSGLLVLRDKMKPMDITWKRRRTYTDPAGVQSTYGYNLPAVLIIGAAVGFVSGLFGIGGGSLFVPLMVLLFRFPPHVATATSMFVIFLSALVGSATHIYMGNVHVFALVALIPGRLQEGGLVRELLGGLVAKR